MMTETETIIAPFQITNDEMMNYNHQSMTSEQYSTKQQ